MHRLEWYHKSTLVAIEKAIEQALSKTLIDLGLSDYLTGSKPTSRAIW
jgi:DICT domain-containing protein